MAKTFRALSEKRIEPVNANDKPPRVTTKQPLSAGPKKGTNKTGVKC